MQVRGATRVNVLLDMYEFAESPRVRAGIGEARQFCCNSRSREDFIENIYLSSVIKRRRRVGYMIGTVD